MQIFPAVPGTQQPTVGVGVGVSVGGGSTTGRPAGIQKEPQDSEGERTPDHGTGEGLSVHVPLSSTVARHGCGLDGGVAPWRQADRPGNRSPLSVTWNGHLDPGVTGSTSTRHGSGGPATQLKGTTPMRGVLPMTAERRSRSEDPLRSGMKIE